MAVKSFQIVIVGAGFTGLSCAYYLSRDPKLKILVVEANKTAGGLAGGFKLDHWSWSLEYFYHHLFTGDKDLFNFLTDIHLKNRINFSRPKTSLLINDQLIKFDSPKDVITYPFLNLVNKFHLALGLGFLKLWPYGLSLEKYTTSQKLPKIISRPAYEQIFAPLLKSKFGQYADNVNLAWFWARIKSRSQRLGYPKGGFGNLASQIVDRLKTKPNIQFSFRTPVTTIDQEGQVFKVKTDKAVIKANLVILTSPPKSWQNYNRLTHDYYSNFIMNKNYLAAQTLILRLRRPLLSDNIYWLNINQTDYPFLIIAEQTHFIDKKYYGNEHLVYIGNYLPINHKYLSYSTKQILKIFWPYLTRLNPYLKRQDIIGSHLFQSEFSQPVMPINYSSQLPPFQVFDSNLFVANMLQVYPYDRGVNYAVRLGRQLADLIQLRLK